MRERSLKNVREGTFRTVAWKRSRGTMGDETVTRDFLCLLIHTPKTLSGAYERLMRLGGPPSKPIIIVVEINGQSISQETWQKIFTPNDVEQ